MVKCETKKKNTEYEIKIPKVSYSNFTLHTLNFTLSKKGMAMKKIILGFLVMAVVLCLGYPVTCEPTPKPGRVDARHIISRTAAIIANAQQAATQRQKYDGLGLAVSHQLLALDLYARNLNGQAIFHSFRARVLAAKVVGGLVMEALFDRIEEKYLPKMPPGKDLDQKLRDSQAQILSDQEAANIQLPMDVQ
jgi:hypothetical protein